MLVKLPHGMCVNPEIVKLVHVRVDRAQRGLPPRFTVVMKTDDDQLHSVATFDTHDQATTLASECGRRINVALGEDDPGSLDGQSVAAPSKKKAEKAKDNAWDDDEDDW